MGPPRAAKVVIGTSRCTVLATALVAASCAGRPEPAQLVLVGGKIATGDPARPEVEALAARRGRVVAIGSEAEVAPYVGRETRVVRLEGRRAVPGFNDAHAHLLSLGRDLRRLDLRSARTWEEVVARVAEAASRERPGGWVLGWGWHQEKWVRRPEPSVEGYPLHGALSRAVPDRPVLLKHASGGHMGLANLAALDRAGIDERTPDPPGGKILRDRAGRPTGVLRETAYDLVLRAYERDRAALGPAQREEEDRLSVEAAVRECAKKGVTTLQDAGSSFETVELLRRMVREGKIPIRLWVMLREPNDRLRRDLPGYRILGEGDRRLTVRAIKRQMDGALGSHGAWLLEPYADLPGSCGHNTEPVTEIEEAARLAVTHGFQLSIHAIGDRANREALDLVERVLSGRPDARALRFRIEHAQHLDPADVARFARLGVVASMQAVHCVSDGPWVPRRIGRGRAEKGAYVWRTLLDAGVVVANGTDAPVEDVDPIAGFHALVTRQMPDGTAFFPEQRMTREEALRAATWAPAFAAFEEDIKGTLVPGRLADVVVLSRDILTVPEDEIRATKVLLTIVGGEVVYEDPSMSARRKPGPGEADTGFRPSPRERDRHERIAQGRSRRRSGAATSRSR